MEAVDTQGLKTRHGAENNGRGEMERKVGDLQVWWIPQVPGKAFEVEVSSVEEGVKLANTLARYDLFQFENKIKPDYCNTGGVQRWCEDSDGEGTPGWEDVDPDDDDSAL